MPDKKPALLKAVASSLKRSESMREPGSGPMIASGAKNVPKRPPKAKYNLPEMTEETKYYSLPRRGKNGSTIRRSNSNCSLKSVDGSTVKPQKNDGDKPVSLLLPAATCQIIHGYHSWF